MFSRTTIVILVFALAAGLGLLVAQKYFADPATRPPQTQAITLFPQPRALPPFSLQQSDGTQLVPGELQGHWTVVFIGFTFCPDVCPTTLAELGQAQRQWEDIPDAVRPRVLFVSVDPERDTPERAGEYAAAFHGDTLAATADIPALEAFTRSLSLVFMKVPGPDGAAANQYTIDHSAALAVLDPQARMAGVISPPFDPAEIAADLRLLTGSR
ncbi:SCO family protein [Luteimonas sp. MHLX1A]|uniref:SCO family protein n=1 Tax=Alterluteimonas muca TaxID=2878684 RepID=UPI001E4324B1|nr:SCO family protein [Luteimonas sp. MHLX1A]MCD9046173.1 SCO family protein [Luteimonas sp. MHLX1A]